MRRSTLTLLAAVALGGPAAATANAETFVLKTGETIEGTVLRAGGNTVTIKLADRGMVQTPIADLRQVEIAVGDGSAVTGTLSAWADGTYLLDTDQGLVAVKDGQIVDDGEGATAVAASAGGPADQSDLKAQFELFLDEFPRESLASLQKDEIFERFLAWQGQWQGR